MVEFTSDYDWFSPHTPLWDAVLTPLKGKEIHALEIGSFEGRSTVWLLDNILTHPKSTITCIDPFKPYDDLKDHPIDFQATEQRFLENVKPYGDKVVHRKIESTDLRKDDGQYDLIYIDGDHTAKQCIIDSIVCHLLLKTKGFLIFDDYMWGKLVKAPNVPKAAIDAFMECFALEYDCISIGYQVILQKK